MGSLWDSFAQKIHSGNIQIDEFVELVEFLKEFDAVNNNVIKDLMAYNLKRFAHFDFIDWDLFKVYIEAGSVHRVVLEHFICALHDFDHANEQVIMYTFDKKHYWSKHHTYRNWVGTFKEGKWKYSKQFNEIHNERGKNE